MHCIIYAAHQITLLSLLKASHATDTYDALSKLWLVRNLNSHLNKWSSQLSDWQILWRERNYNSIQFIGCSVTNRGHRSLYIDSDAGGKRLLGVLPHGDREVFAWVRFFAWILKCPSGHCYYWLLDWITLLVKFSGNIRFSWWMFLGKAKQLQRSFTNSESSNVIKHWPLFAKQAYCIRITPPNPRGSDNTGKYCPRPAGPRAIFFRIVTSSWIGGCNTDIMSYPYQPISGMQ